MANHLQEPETLPEEGHRGDTPKPSPPILTTQSRGEYDRDCVHNPNFVFDFQRNTTKSHQTLIASMTRLVNLGVKFMVDIATGDANSACNRLNSKQLLSHPQVSTLNIVMEGIAEVFNAKQGDPLKQILISSGCAASIHS